MHVYAKSLFVYQLIKILNEFNNSVIIKFNLKEKKFFFPGFSNYGTLKFINNYSDKQFAISQIVMHVKGTYSFS